MPTDVAESPLDCDQILRIAHLDAKRVYGDLTGFRITLRRQPDGWHIGYDPESPDVQGGGPHYLIDPVDGTILKKTYYQ